MPNDVRHVHAKPCERLHTGAFAAVVFAVALALAWAWLLIERNAGDLTVVSLTRVRLEVKDELVFQPESDGLSALVSGMNFSNVRKLAIEPCPFDGTECSVEPGSSGRVHAVVTGDGPPDSPADKRPIYLPLFRVRPRALSSGVNCSANVELTSVREGMAKLRLLVDEPSKGCIGTLETTIFDSSASATAKSELILKLIEGNFPGRPEHEVRLRCSRVENDCRITLRAEPIASKNATEYVLGRAGDGVILRGTSSTSPKLLSLSGDLASRASDDAAPASCRDLPGDVWRFTAPSLRRLVLHGGDPPVFQAALSDYRTVDCSFPIKDFLSRLGVILGVPTLLELARCLRESLRCRAAGRNPGGTP